MDYSTARIDERVKRVLRDNRKMRLHVLMVLWASTQPLSARQISDELDCDPDTVESALHRMLADGYVSRWPEGRHAKWWLGDKAGQLPLPGLALISEGEIPPLSVPTTTTALLSSPDPVKAVVEAGREGEKTPLRPRKLTAVEQALKSAGIGRNMWPELSALPYVTAAYVKAHDVYRRARGESTGMLITRLRGGDSAPKEEKKKTDKQNERFKADAERMKKTCPQCGSGCFALFNGVCVECDEKNVK